MVGYVVIGILLVLMLVYILVRKPVWITQVTFTGKTIHVCSNCGEIWTPTMYSGIPLEMSPPTECPHCHKKMRGS